MQGSSSPAGSLGEPREAFSATLLPNGGVLIAGGWGGGHKLASAEVWDPRTEACRSAGSMLQSREFHTAVALRDGRVLVIGGQGDDRPYLATAELWDPSSDTFGPAGALPEARFDYTVTVLTDGRVLVVGGHDPDAEPPGDDVGYVPLATAQIWDPATASFDWAGTLAEARLAHTATLLADGRVLVVGGGDGVWDPIASAEVWVPRTGSFEPAGTLAEARLAHTATLLPDGLVLVAGGNETDPETVELWDPATRSFAEVPASGSASGGASSARAEPAHTAGSMARDGEVATTLADGRVLVIDGSGQAELWTPSD